MSNITLPFLLTYKDNDLHHEGEILSFINSIENHKDVLLILFNSNQTNFDLLKKHLDDIRDIYIARKDKNWLIIIPESLFKEFSAFLQEMLPVVVALKPFTKRDTANLVPTIQDIIKKKLQINEIVDFSVYGINLPTNNQIVNRVFADKLSRLQNIQTTIFCVGAVYADLSISHDTTEQGPLILKNDVEDIIFRHKATIGGSTWAVAQKINEQLKTPNVIKLITKIGDMSIGSYDPYAGFIGQILRESGLMVDRQGANLWWYPGGATPWTILINWLDNTTMLTYPGIINTLEWDDVYKQMSTVPNVDMHNKIVYIGGYFKTALYKNIQTVLADFDKRNIIVAIDPGRLEWINPDFVDMNSLDPFTKEQIYRQTNLRRNLDKIDIYLASAFEFRTFFTDVFHALPKFDVKAALDYLVGQKDILLPRLMCIRDKKKNRIYLYPGGTIIDVDLGSSIYSSSIFNARFLTKLYDIVANPHNTLIDDIEIVKLCAEYAIMDH